MLVPATQMSTKVAARLGGKLSDVASRAQGVNIITSNRYICRKRLILKFLGVNNMLLVFAQSYTQLRSDCNESQSST